MLYNRINICLAGVLIIILYFLVPDNNKWLYGKIIDNVSIFSQWERMDEEARREERFGYSYMVYKSLAEKIKNKQVVLLLLPPQAQCEKVKENSFVIPEPSVLYYYTGVRAVWASSPDARLANSELRVNGPGKFDLQRIYSPARLDSLIAVYKPMLPK